MFLWMTVDISITRYETELFLTESQPSRVSLKKCGAPPQLSDLVLWRDTWMSYWKFGSMNNN